LPDSNKFDFILFYYYLRVISAGCDKQLKRRTMTVDETFGVTTEEMYFIASMLVVLSVFGTAGNAVVLYVFSTTKDNLVSTLFIIVLAVVDFSTCVVVIPFTIGVELVSYRVRFDVVCKLYQFLITSNIPFSALIMTAIAVDRYLCICHPFAHLLTLSRARTVVLVLAAFASGLGVVGAFTHGVYAVAAANATGSGADSTRDENRTRTDAVYTGYCAPNELIVSKQFALAFQRCYTAVFVVCLAVVIVLYALIYQSVLRQRHKRQQMKAAPIRMQTPIVTQQSPAVEDHTSVCVAGASPAKGRNATVQTPRGEDDDDAAAAGLEASSEAVKLVAASPTDGLGKRVDVASTPATGTPAAAAAADAARRNRIANIKTAAMLFVVTLVFTVLFMPSLAMTVHILPYNMTIFYMYFANNVANPVIYSFMNSNFRKRLAHLFCKYSQRS